VEPPAALPIARGAEGARVVRVRLRPGFHANSNTPADEFLIPLRLTWEPAPLEVRGIEYPKPSMETYSFSEQPLSVFTGDFDIATRFAAPANAPPGRRTLIGKLRYQACDNRACYPPRTIQFWLPVDIQ
jgi:hypothetical protein